MLVSRQQNLPLAIYSLAGIPAWKQKRGELANLPCRNDYRRAACFMKSQKIVVIKLNVQTPRLRRCPGVESSLHRHETLRQAACSTLTAWEDSAPDKHVLCAADTGSGFSDDPNTVLAACCDKGFMFLVMTYRLYLPSRPLLQFLSTLEVQVLSSEA